MFLDHLARVIAHLPRLRVYWRSLLPVVMIVVQQLPVAGNQGTCNRIRLFGDICIDLKDVFAFFSNQAACRLTLACELNVLAA